MHGVSIVAKHLQQHTQSYGGILTVVGDQDFAPGPRGRRMTDWLARRHGSLALLQTNDKLTPLSLARTMSFYTAVVQLNEALRHRQADAQPAARTLRGAVHLREELKHFVQHVGRDANSGVTYPDYH